MTRNMTSLGEVAQFINGAAFKPEDWGDSGFPIIRIQNLTDESKPFNRTTRTVAEKLQVHPGDLLVSWSATLGVFTWKRPEIGLLNQHIFRVIPDESKVDKAYLRLALSGALSAMQKHLHGATMQHVNRGEFLGTPLYLPPLEEQRRIAAILDQAETLRTQRRTALALLDSLTQSLFLDMFGDPVANPKGWDALQFGNGIAASLRNGLSPSTDGKVMAKVLTLSAITGESFNPDAWKLAPFHTEPPAQQAVYENDFLICRGNGNVKLVGKGYFPSRSFTDVTFPDTIIAARINGQNIKREYLQFIWNSKAVRLQIEALARTTNGTFKVNQTMLERIQILVPPLPIQQTFATRIASIEALKATHRRALAALDALFASLQQRAFTGAL